MIRLRIKGLLGCIEGVPGLAWQRRARPRALKISKGAASSLNDDNVQKKDGIGFCRLVYTLIWILLWKFYQPILAGKACLPAGKRCVRKGSEHKAAGQQDPSRIFLAEHLPLPRLLSLGTQKTT